MMDFNVVWQMECYVELNFKVPKHKFVTFDGLKTRIGVNFHCDKECYEFVSVVSERVCRRKLPILPNLPIYSCGFNSSKLYRITSEQTEN